MGSAFSACECFARQKPPDANGDEAFIIATTEKLGAVVNGSERAVEILLMAPDQNASQEVAAAADDGNAAGSSVDLDSATSHANGNDVFAFGTARGFDSAGKGSAAAVDTPVGASRDKDAGQEVVAAADTVSATSGSTGLAATPLAPSRQYVPLRLRKKGAGATAEEVPRDQPRSPGLLDEDAFGTSSVGAAVSRNKRSTPKPMEDTVVVTPLLAKDSRMGTAYAVLDGHGGVEAVEAASRVLPQYLSAAAMQLLHEEEAIVEEALRSIVANVEKATVASLVANKTASTDDISSGCTLTLVVYAQCRIAIAHVGDSIAFGCRALTESPYSTYPCFTVAHQPGVDAERKRLAAACVQVKESYDDSGAVMVRLAETGLAVSRALGDIEWTTEAKVAGVVAEPQINFVHVDEPLEFFALITDGLTERTRVNDVGKTIRRLLRCQGPREAAKGAIALAQQMGSLDDCAAIVVPLKKGL